MTETADPYPVHLMHPDDLYLKSKGITPLPPLPTADEMLAEIDKRVEEKHGARPEFTWADVEASVKATAKADRR